MLTNNSEYPSTPSEPIECLCTLTKSVLFSVVYIFYLFLLRVVLVLIFLLFLLIRLLQLNLLYQKPLPIPAKPQNDLLKLLFLSQASAFARQVGLGDLHESVM